MRVNKMDSLKTEFNHAEIVKCVFLDSPGVLSPVLWGDPVLPTLCRKKKNTSLNMSIGNQ